MNDDEFRAARAHGSEVLMKLSLADAGALLTMLGGSSSAFMQRELMGDEWVKEQYVRAIWMRFEAARENAKTLQAVKRGFAALGVSCSLRAE